MPRDRVLELGEFRVDVAGRSVSRRGEVVALPPKAVETLILLAENPGKTVLKEELLDTVWAGTFVEEGSLTQAISILRKALGERSDGQQWIRTIPKRGYCYVGPVGAVTDWPELSAAPSTTAPGRLRIRPIAITILVAVLVTAAIAMLTVIVMRRRGARAPAHRARLVVLPVENLSGNAQHDYVSDGLTEELIAQLSTLDAGRLAVIARTSAMAYKGTHKPVDRIARELDVDYILESSLRWSGDRLRITAQLVRTEDQSYVWAGTYDRTAQDMLSMEDEVARAIAQQIDSKLPGRTRSRPPEPAAYLPYLEGRYYWNKRTRESIAQAIVLLRRAIALDPRYARAHSALADCYLSLGLLGAGRPEELFASAKDEARKALALDPNLAEAHASLAYLKFWEEWDWTAAESEFRKAIALNPDYATAHQWYAEYLRLMGRFDESIAESRKALDLDPLSLVINMEAGLPYYFRHEYDKAGEHFRRAIALDPNFALAYVELGWAYEDSGDLPAAITTLQKAAQLDNTTPVMTALANAYAAAGRKAEAVRILQTLEERAKTSYVSPFLLATVHLGLGEKEKSLALLERAYEEHDWALIWANVSPRLDPLRSDPRFQSVLSRMKFPPHRS
ncbi:MAG TPA: tetratricopeptide repeat protein [Thermoanaerobaculia bacterium]|jgi:TolB-like protein/DNA-binding winged helix-turn-helix (wHTH) protein/Flp pilus assembly protein TadD|nr:tetratricopeptide repeat protein [Thermoanaerobaculia bacterium]